MSLQDIGKKCNFYKNHSLMPRQFIVQIFSTKCTRFHFKFGAKTLGRSLRLTFHDQVVADLVQTKMVLRRASVVCRVAEIESGYPDTCSACFDPYPVVLFGRDSAVEKGEFFYERNVNQKIGKMVA